MFLSLHHFAALILILCVHEWAHAWVAFRLGDPTAEREGRMSLNPMRHLDLLGTLMLFFVGIGWGKPVPVNPRNFKHPVRDEVLTALAGPFANLVLAVLAAIPLAYLPLVGADLARDFFAALLDLSLVLGIFNLLPFPPLDGSRLVEALLPLRFQDFFEKSLPWFLLFMLIDLYVFPQVFGLSFVWTIVSTATYWLKAAILVLV